MDKYLLDQKNYSMFICKYKNVEEMKEAQIRYRINNPQTKEEQKIYREQNKESISEKRKQKINCECGTSFNLSGKSRHLKTKKHLSYLESKKTTF